jgi:aldehyde:ferredoxin oxidoreductase
MSKLCGWVGKILRVNLSTGKISALHTTRYIPEFLGGKGLNHRIAWEEIPKGIGAFDPQNRLLISTGPLTGTPAPTSGKFTVGGVSAQSYPEVYSYSCCGGWFGAELKYAGFDGIIIQGKAPSLSYLWINDGEAEIKQANDLHNLGTYDTQKKLRAKHGTGTCVFCIGPAGENKSRIAVILTDTQNAAGQGGYGGVMGSKNLKAIAVRGTGSIKIANPEELLNILNDLYPEKTRKKTKAKIPSDYNWDGHTIKYLPYKRYRKACTHACPKPCVFWDFKDVPFETRLGTHSGQLGCVAPYVIEWQHPFGIEWPLWKQGFKGGFESSALLNQYGIDEYEFLAGMMPWIVMATKEGILTEEDVGMPIKPNDTSWWIKLIQMIAYRRGFGDLLAEGTSRAINKLGKEYEEKISHERKKIPTKISLQEAWGYCAHWSGRGVHSNLRFPDWLLTALVWMTSTRDPLSDTHIVIGDTSQEPLIRARKDWVKKFREEPYGKAGVQIAIWSEHRSALKSSLTLCDLAFPMTDNTDAERRLYSAVTGIDITEDELDMVGERIKNMERALLIRNYDRSRSVEYNEIKDFFKRPDGTKGTSMNETKFKGMVDKYYELRGWDKETGWPTRIKLEELGLKDVADRLMELGKLP